MPTDKEAGRCDGYNGTPSIVHRGNAEYDAGYRQAAYESGVKGMVDIINNIGSGERLDRPSTSKSSRYLGISLIMCIVIGIIAGLIVGIANNHLGAGLVTFGVCFCILGKISEMIFEEY